MAPLKQIKNSTDFCVKCNKSYKYLQDHNYHVHRDKGKLKLLKCTECDKSYTRRGSLSNHIKSLHSTTVFKCPQCEKVLSCKGHLKRHVKFAHDKNTEEFIKCYFCVSQSHAFVDSAALFNHMRGVHLKELPFTCRKNSYCIRRFAYIGKARTHSLCPTKEGWNIANNKRKVCYFCSTAFYSYEDLRKHLNKEHTFETHYRCGLCQQPFNKYDSLRKHILSIHVNKKYLKCENCEYRTNSNTQLVIHKAQEHNKRYTKHCYFCKLGFAKNSTLISHMSHHTMEQLPNLIYPCYFCDKSFGSKRYLYLHLRSKHLDEPGGRGYKQSQSIGKIHSSNYVY